jgi:hypothetical protein
MNDKRFPVVTEYKYEAGIGNSSDPRSPCFAKRGFWHFIPVIAVVAFEATVQPLAAINTCNGHNTGLRSLGWHEEPTFFVIMAKQLANSIVEMIELKEYLKKRR